GGAVFRHVAVIAADDRVQGRHRLAEAQRVLDGAVELNGVALQVAEQGELGGAFGGDDPAGAGVGQMDRGDLGGDFFGWRFDGRIFGTHDTPSSAVPLARCRARLDRRRPRQAALRSSSSSFSNCPMATSLASAASRASITSPSMAPRRVATGNWRFSATALNP